MPVRGFPCTLVAAQTRFCGMTISVGDVVFRETVVGKVTACASERGHCFFTIVEVWQAVGFVTPYSRKCRRTAAIEAWPAEHLEQALAWYHDET